MVGLNLQEFQLKRARLHTEREGLQESCSYIQVREGVGNLTSLMQAQLVLSNILISVSMI